MTSLGEPLDAKTDAEKKIAPRDEPALPAIDCDVLFGLGAIARWLGITVGQAKALVDDGTVPTFKPPGRSARCALKSAINEAFAEYARRSAARKSAA
ncbi:hypothetical protein SAMN05444159_7585 [Bradyrhizobium lablabi]|uniref:Uncharacterized protein n=1 Tax=Bradyrhizobium lablabi TaxID=722472 RepID=A0A1M7FSM3_9BRAD|nr:hypothetical protein [Bradyrhizobium lablabi]SHM06788.1 hypothetical protein SAMN05444159_7585 [Bradyrhizobium lablabi]